MERNHYVNQVFLNDWFDSEAYAYRDALLDDTHKLFYGKQAIKAVYPFKYGYGICCVQVDVIAHYAHVTAALVSLHDSYGQAA